MPQMGWLARQDGYDPDAFDVPLEQTYDRRFDQTWPGKLAQEAIGAVLAPGRALQSTEPITTEQMIKPAVDLAGLVTGGSYAAPAQRGASGAGIRAYHSSPHDFDKFDLAKIGTGEGAQAYGHGLYFAENPAVSGQGGQYWNQFIHKFPKEEMRAAEALRQYGFDREATIAEMRRQMVDPRMHHTPDSLARAQAKLDILESGKPVGPRTYEVNINADPAHMLDWDKPLSAQPHATKTIMDILPAAERRRIERWEKPGWSEGDPKASYFDTVKGGTEYQGLAGILGKSDAASAALREAGIPGIKYLDQGSRNYSDIAPFIAQHGGTDKALAYARGRHAETMKQYGEGSVDARDWAKTIQEILNPPTSNYVIFDPNIIRIDKKYALPLAAAPAGMGALAAQDRYE